MQSDFCEVEKNTLNNNNNLEMDACAAQKDKSTAATTASKDELHDNEEDLENNVAYSDSDDGDQFINSFEEEYDVQLSSPPSSRSPSNSDNDQRWYAYRGRWGINLLENRENPANGEGGSVDNDNRLAVINNQQYHNHAPLPQQQQPQQPQQQQNLQQQQEEEETDFLEMDFEPDTNSEIENENEARFVNFDLRNGHDHQFPPILQQQQQQQPSAMNGDRQENMNHQMPSASKSTGAKPKQLSMIRNLKSPKSHPQQQQHATYGDNIFKITGHLHSDEYNVAMSSAAAASALSPLSHKDSNDVYNVGASCSRNLSSALQANDKSYQNVRLQIPTEHSNHHHHNNHHHKSPSKSSYHSHKQQRLHEEQNDQFLFELDPIKPRNSVTIYTSNCDEKILMDALTSLKLKPDREMILKYFSNSSRPSAENLVDYIIYRSKQHCNYLKLIELIKGSCKSDNDDEYGAKKFDINFYPLDFFSTTPEMIDVDVSEIVKRWTPQTDLSALVQIRNKYFVQTNVLGKLVNIIRRINNQKPLTTTFKENETIKIPQYYVSGYLTIASLRNPT